MSQPYTQEFQQAREELMKCQKEKQLSSCMQCPKILECHTRERYVKETYSHLSKGKNGEFSF